MESEKLKHEIEIEKKREENANIDGFKKGKLSKLLITCAVICFIFTASGINNSKYNIRYLLPSIVFAVQSILFTAAWFVGADIIKLKNKNSFGIMILCAFALFTLSLSLMP